MTTRASEPRGAPRRMSYRSSKSFERILKNGRNSWPLRLEKALEHSRPVDETAELRAILLDLRQLTLRRALTAWRRSPENLSGEVVALKDVDQAMQGLGADS